MRRPGRFTATLAAMLLLFAVAAVASASGAAAAPVVQMSGAAAPAVAHTPQRVVFTYTITVPAAISATTFTTHQPAALPAATTGATLDGTPVPTAQVTRAGTVDITIQTGAAPGDGLAAGAHTITFNAQAAGAATTTASSTATLRWTRASTPASLTSAAVIVAINQPDIAVTDLVPNVYSIPEVTGATGFIGTGMEVQLNVDVMNLGFGAPHTTLSITLPTGMVLDFAIRDVDADGGPPLTCAQIGAAPVQVTCPLGALPHFPSGDAGVQIFVTTTAHPPVGTVGTVTVSAAPDPGQGTDTNPANNTASTSLRFTGLAALSATITPAATQIPVGAHTAVTVTIHNAGPQPAEQTVAFIEAVGNGDKTSKAPCCPLDIVGFTSNGGVLQAGEWDVGTIAPGATVTAILTVKAVMAGTGAVALSGAASTATDPACPNETCITASATIQAVPVQTTTTPPAPTPATTTAGPVLAATGAATRPLLALSVLLLLSGATLTAAARRRHLR